LASTISRWAKVVGGTSSTNEVACEMPSPVGTQPASPAFKPPRQPTTQDVRRVHLEIPRWKHRCRAGARLEMQPAERMVGTGSCGWKPCDSINTNAEPWYHHGHCGISSSGRLGRWVKLEKTAGEQMWTGELS
jgi:hypothetical protein